MWQKCPICDGVGREVTLDYAHTLYKNCGTCKGKGIISELTGLPPKGVETFASPKYRNSDGSPVTDFRDNCESFEDK
jgi:DnaJ-class molecular chaperone